MRDSNSVVLGLTMAVGPVLGDAILQSSVADVDESFWLAALQAADSGTGPNAGPSSQARQPAANRPRSFWNMRDQLEAIAAHGRYLHRGENPLMRDWANELSALIDQADSDVEMRSGDVDRFLETLQLLLESLGSSLPEGLMGSSTGATAQPAPSAQSGAAESGAAEPGAASAAEAVPGAAPHRSLTLEVGGLRANIELAAAYTRRLTGMGVGPIRALSITNTAEPDQAGPSALAACQIIGTSGTVEWTAPRVEVAPGETVALTPAELAWVPVLPGAASTGSDDLHAEFDMSVGGRSRAADIAVPLLTDDEWRSDLPPELLVDFIPFSSPRVARMARAVESVVNALDEPEDADYAGAVNTELNRVLGTSVGDARTPDGGQRLRHVTHLFTGTNGADHANGAGGAAGQDIRVTGMERALIAAAVLELLGCSAVFVMTPDGVRCGLGNPETSPFDARTLSRGAFSADISGVEPVGGSRAAFESDALYIVRVADLLDRATANSSAGDSALGEGTTRPPILSRWLKELLQLDNRNPLLRMAKTAGARIVVPEDRLALFEDAFSSGERFDLAPLSKRVSAAANTQEANPAPQPVAKPGRPVIRPAVSDRAGASATGNRVPSASVPAAPSVPPTVGAAEDAFTAALDAHQLQVEPLRDNYRKLLTNLQAQSEKSREESGKTTLHLVVGAVTWQDDAGDESTSPLFVAPANLTGSADTGFALALEPGYALEPNFTLHEKLRQVTGEEVPSLLEPVRDASGIDVDATFERVSQELSAAGIRHRILRHARLLPLDFATQVLWSDLRDNWATLLDKPVADQLTRRFGTPFADPAGDRALTPADEVTTTLVQPADGSQLRAIAYAGAGKSFVLEGPPGTGKSQTITNMIADGLARGRRILFVAEKRAALDVVFGRLKDAGLGHAVLDLHDAKQSLRDARGQLREALDRLPSGGTAAAAAGEMGATGMPGAAAGTATATGAATSAPVTGTDRLRAALHASTDLLRAYPNDVFHVKHGQDSRGEPQYLWDLFRVQLERESEFDMTGGWQPAEVPAAADLSSEQAEHAADVAKRLRRARRHADSSPDDAATLAKLDAQADAMAGLGLSDAAQEVRAGRSADQLAEAILLANSRAALDRALAELEDPAAFTGRPAAVRRYIEQARALILAHRATPPGALGDPQRALEIDDAFRAYVRGTSSGSVRTLFEEYGEQVLAATPCVLMSPLGVAKHLPAGSIEFDTVIFDEASQIRPATAMSALGRARSAVIVGDRKQMPPPTEFTGRVDGGDAGDTLAIPQGRLESLLTLAGKAGFEHLSLDWHYRSSNEQLIAFSNRRYYNGKLITFPNPPAVAGEGAADGAGTSASDVPGAGAADPSASDRAGAPGAGALPIGYTFVRGVQERKPGYSAKVNEAERDAVVERIAGLLAEQPDKSIMVVTFNSAQQDYIAAALAESKDDGIVAAMNRDVEPLTVKNVETVQGDERDIVLFSMTYAPDAETGQRSNNFGPVARPGGELRFNVAITRAREQVQIFASMHAADITIGKSTRPGVRDMKAYLAMAEEGVLPRVEAAPQGDDIFRDRVAEQLRARGFEVEVGVGESEFAVDLAVREAADSVPGTAGGAGGAASADGAGAESAAPWSAVLLDSPLWAGRATVWDRDGLPVTMLEDRMHWHRVARLLSADWALDPGAALDRLIAQLRETDAEAGPAGTYDEAGAAVDVAGEVDGVTAAAPATDATTADVAAAGASTVSAGTADAATGPTATGPTSGIVEEQYVEAPVRAVDDKTLLDRVEHSEEARERVRGHIADILALEAPIEKTELLRRVALRMSHKRLRDRIAAQIAPLVSQRTLAEDDGREFVWSDEQDPEAYNVYRVPGPGQAARNLQDMSQRELGNAIVAALSQDGAATGADLLAEVVEMFGGRRTSKPAQDAFNRAISLAERSGRITRTAEADGFTLA
ncbi:AAA domain-containing protein [Brevibacterium moorei]|uniref:AAA domain-containing protein n=1 Tax=Brevibacterium moorei TaxID=2968457 RepID=UPI00211C4B2A|nr:AAA domain-containing protein [Brevibacterium sp. 68QC2CO]